MRTETRTVRIGELLGPVDWSYDFDQHGWGPGRGGGNPECIREGKEVLRIVEQALADGKRVTFTPSDFSAFEVVQCGMYDGWPFWQPTPYIGYIGPLGVLEWTPFYNLCRSRVRIGGARP